MSSEIFISVEAGKIKEKTKFIKFLYELKDAVYMVKFERKNKRTNQQNRYLHGVLFPEFRKALREVGYNEVKTDEQAKEIAKRMFLTAQIPNENTGEVIEYVKETHKLTTIELNEFIEDVIRFTAENLNYEIPYPNEQVKFDF